MLLLSCTVDHGVPAALVAYNNLTNANPNYVTGDMVAMMTRRGA